MAREMKDSGIEWIGKIPSDWEIYRNKQLFREINERCENGSDYTLLSVSEYYGVAPKADKIAEGDFETHAESLDGYKKCSPDDIVMNIMLAWKRATGRSTYEGIISPAYCVYRPITEIDTRYFHYLFRTDLCANMFKRYSTGIIDSRLRLYPDQFMALYSPVPHKNEQVRIADFLDHRCAEIDSVIANTQRTIEEYKVLKQSIITDAVTKGVRGKRTMKDSGIEWIGEIPVEWEIRKLFRAIDNLGDIDHYMPNSVDTGIPYLMTGDLKEKLSDVDFDSCKMVSLDDYQTLSSKIKANKGDIIFARYATIGTVCFVDIEKEFLVSYSCLTIKTTENLLLGRFLFYYLKSSAFFEEVNQYINSNTQANVGLDSMTKAKVILPKIEEQTQIADYLDKKCAEIDTLIAKKIALLEELESYKKSVIYEYVTGKKQV